MNRIWPGRSIARSTACGSLTLTIISAAREHLGGRADDRRAGAAVGVVVHADAEPRLCSTITSWPCATASRTLPGTMPTRFSRTLISFGTPIRMRALPGSGRHSRWCGAQWRDAAAHTAAPPQRCTICRLSMLAQHRPDAAPPRRRGRANRRPRWATPNSRSTTRPPHGRSRSTNTGCRSRRTANSRPTRRWSSARKGMYFWNDHGDKIIDASSGLFCVVRGPRPQGDRRGRRQAAARARLLRAVPARAPEAVRARDARRRADAGRPQPRSSSRNSGSEAVDTAMKIALAYHQARGQGGRNVFVSRERAYHGVNFGGVALSGLVNNRRKFGPGLPGIAHMRHTHLKENFFTPGEGAHGAELAEDLLRIVNLYGAGEHRRLLRRADRRLHRLPRAAEGLPQAPARDLRRARHPAGVRRGDLPASAAPAQTFAAQSFGVTPDLMTMAKAHHQRRAADGRGRRQRAHPRHDHGRGARGRDRVLPRLHVLRPSGAPARRASPRSTSTRDDGLFERGRALSPYFLDAIFSLKDLPVVTDIRGYGMMAAIDVARGRRAGQARAAVPEEALRQRPQPQDDRRLRRSSRRR